MRADIAQKFVSIKSIAGDLEAGGGTWQVRVEGIVNQVIDGWLTSRFVFQRAARWSHPPEVRHQSGMVALFRVMAALHQ